MTSRLTNRITKIELRIAPVDILKWMNAPVELLPDWVLISHIVGRPVSPEEAADIYEDEGFWAENEARVASTDAK